MNRDAWAIFVSGRGSNAQVLLDELDEYPVRLMVSSRSKVGALARARRRGIQTLILPQTINWSLLDEQLRNYKITHILLLGFMKIVPPDFVEKWSNKIFNLHPSLLPTFPGLRAIENSYACQAPMGVSLHLVTDEMDAGKLIFQKHTTIGKNYDFQSTEFLISRDEQLLVRRHSSHLASAGVMA
jgi:phosphoribosylglycinamide formyltransferase-1